MKWKSWCIRNEKKRRAEQRKRIHNKDTTKYDDDQGIKKNTMVDFNAKIGKNSWNWKQTRKGRFNTISGATKLILLSEGRIKNGISILPIQKQIYFQRHYSTEPIYNRSRLSYVRCKHILNKNINMFKSRIKKW